MATLSNGNLDLLIDLARQEQDIAAAAVTLLALEGAVRWDALVVVMHSHGHDSLSDSLWGSHAERVLRDTFVPLVIVWGG